MRYTLLLFLSMAYLTACASSPQVSALPPATSVAAMATPVPTFHPAATTPPTSTNIPLATTTATTLPTATETAAPSATPTLSPTPIGGAAWLAFDSQQCTSKSAPCNYLGVSLIHLDGSQPQTVAGAGFRLVRLSPDGRQALVGNHTSLSVMNLDGSGAFLLSDKATDAYWLPDGKQIAMIATEGKEQHIFLVNADGTAPQRLTATGSNPSPLNLVPSYDATKVYWEKGQIGPSRATIDGYWSINIDGTALAQLTPKTMSNPAFSSAGYIAYQNFQQVPGAVGHYTLALVVSKTDASDAVTVYAPATSHDLVGSYAWSPDGTRLVYEEQSCNPSCDSSQYFVWSSSAAGLVALPITIGRSRSPIWSPDGQQILFRTCSNVICNQLKLLNLGTQAVSQIPLSLPAGAFIEQAAFVP